MSRERKGGGRRGGGRGREGEKGRGEEDEWGEEGRREKRRGEEGTEGGEENRLLISWQNTVLSSDIVPFVPLFFWVKHS